MNTQVWDVVVVGAGPGGLQCALAAASEGLTVLVLERSFVGGQIGQTPLLENSVFAQGGKTGPQIAREMRDQAERLGAVVQYGDVRSLERAGDRLHLEVWAAGQTKQVMGQKVVLAMGQQWRHIDVPGLAAAMKKRRVHYGPVDSIVLPGDAGVAVYGGGPSAGQAILALADQGHTVHVILRSTLAMPQYLVDRIHERRTAGKVVLHLHSTVKRVAAVGDGPLGLLITGQDGEPRTIEGVAHLFMCNGLEPATQWVPDVVSLDEEGRILTGHRIGRLLSLETSMDGVFAIGDCRSGSTARVGVAIGDGSMVVTELWQHFVKSRTCRNCEKVLGVPRVNVA